MSSLCWAWHTLLLFGRLITFYYSSNSSNDWQRPYLIYRLFNQVLNLKKPQKLRNIELNIKTNNGWTLKIWTCRNGHKKLSKWNKTKVRQFCQFLSSVYDEKYWQPQKNMIWNSNPQFFMPIFLPSPSLLNSCVIEDVLIVLYTKCISL